ncbi:hypothetical protein C0Q70_21025 [Pomacea canaliculata]|uniref:Uncharacterized protein n=1 Tax=Pomacea canaliculata TaxID=400727 RepID=A0A2T7NBC3_POMCA|nr:hypothetical protein C0Q70_21025 [Pomacea canaliculata]
MSGDAEAPYSASNCRPPIIVPTAHQGGWRERTCIALLGWRRQLESSARQIYDTGSLKMVE